MNIAGRRYEDIAAGRSREKESEAGSVRPRARRGGTRRSIVILAGAAVAMGALLTAWSALWN